MGPTFAFTSAILRKRLRAGGGVLSTAASWPAPRTAAGLWAASAVTVQLLVREVTESPCSGTTRQGGERVPGWTGVRGQVRQDRKGIRFFESGGGSSRPTTGGCARQK